MNTSNKATITEDDIKKIAYLARLKIDEATIDKHVNNLSHILEMLTHINDQDTSDVPPMSSSLNATLAMRSDTVTETNQR